MINEKEDKYSKILDSAIKVFADLGVENSTISKIASTAGVADGTIYLYFKNKNDILIQFAKDRGEKIFTKFEKEIKRGRDAQEKLYNLFFTHLSEFSANRELAVVYQAEVSKIHSAKPHIRALSKRYRSLIREILNSGKEDGLVDKNIDVDLIKNLILGAVNETINTEIIDNKNKKTKDLADKLINLFFKGIGVNS